MKTLLKIFITFAQITFILSWSILSFGGMIIGLSGPPPAPCDWTSAPMGWNGEAPTNTDACLANDTYLSGTLSGATIVTDPDNTYGNVLLIDADADYLKWSVTSAEITGAEFLIRFRVRTGNQLGSTYLFSYPSNRTGNGVTAWLDTNEKVNAIYQSGAIVSMTTTAVVPQNTWTNITVAGKQAGDLHGQGSGVILGIAVNDSWEYESDADTPTTLADQTDFSLGWDNAASHNANIYIEGLETWPSSTKQPF